jgi:hypothetical protein
MNRRRRQLRDLKPGGDDCRKLQGLRFRSPLQGLDAKPGPHILRVPLAIARAGLAPEPIEADVGRDSETRKSKMYQRCINPLSTRRFATVRPVLQGPAAPHVTDTGQHTTTQDNTETYPLNRLFSDLGAGVREFESPHPDQVAGVRRLERQMPDSRLINWRCSSSSGVASPAMAFSVARLGFDVAGIDTVVAGWLSPHCSNA